MLMEGDPMVFPFSTTAQGPSPARSHTMLDGTRGFSAPPLGEMGQGPLPHTPQRGSWIPRGDVMGTQFHRAQAHKTSLLPSCKTSSLLLTQTQ